MNIVNSKIKIGRGPCMKSSRSQNLEYTSYAIANYEMTTTTDNKSYLNNEATVTAIIAFTGHGTNRMK